MLYPDRVGGPCRGIYVFYLLQNFQPVPILGGDEFQEAVLAVIEGVIKSNI